MINCTIHKCITLGRHAHVVSEINQWGLHSCEVKEIINCLHYDVQELDRFHQQISTIIYIYIIVRKNSLLKLTKAQILTKMKLPTILYKTYHHESCIIHRHVGNMFFLTSEI